MDGSTYLKSISKEWKAKGEIIREEFRVNAKEIRDDPCKGQPRGAVISSQLNIIN